MSVMSLSGRASIGDGAWFRQLLELHAVEGPDRITADLSRLSSMDWWAAQFLLWVSQVVRRRGGMLEVTGARPPAVARLLNAEIIGERQGGHGHYEPIP
jgi:anti-anti-sigma regulatory factor